MEYKINSNIMKKIVSLGLLGATTSLMAIYGEHAYLYKDPRVMGMGGANVAVGGYSTSVFSNPAGLASIEKDHGIVVDLLGIGGSASAQFKDFKDDYDDMQDEGLSDAEKTSATIELLEKYAGDHLHVGLDNYTAVSKNSDKFAWSVGAIGALDTNIVTHANGSIDGGFLSTSSRLYYGAILGIAKEYPTKVGRLDIGLSGKYITQKSYEGSLGVSALSSEDALEELQDTYEKESDGYGIDIGVKYYPFAGSFLNPTLGASILNIGDMSMDDNYGGQPMTVNVGMAISPKIKYINKFVLAVDYVDLLDANEVRVYEYSGTYTDYSESDMMKRVRLGTSLGLYDSRFFSLTANGGYYQEAYTAGLDLQLLILKLNAATYQEQIGTGSIDITDRRYMLKAAIGW